MHVHISMLLLAIALFTESYYLSPSYHKNIIISRRLLIYWCGLSKTVRRQQKKDTNTTVRLITRVLSWYMIHVHVFVQKVFCDMFFSYVNKTQISLRRKLGKGKIFVCPCSCPQTSEILFVRQTTHNKTTYKHKLAPNLAWMGFRGLIQFNTRSVWTNGSRNDWIDTIKPIRARLGASLNSASTLKEISFWKEIFARWRKFEGNKFWGKYEGNSRRRKEIWRKK